MAVKQYVEEGSTIMSDEGSGYSFLNIYFDHLRINHGTLYAEDGKSINRAESFHGRVWRSNKGTYHRMAHGPDFDLYLAELAFRHSFSETDTKTLWKKFLGLLLQHPPSARFTGYWQGAMAH